MWGKELNKHFFHGLGELKQSTSLSVQTPVFTLWLRVNNHFEQSWHIRGKGHHGELLCLLLKLSSNLKKKWWQECKSSRGEWRDGKSELVSVKRERAELTLQLIIENLNVR